MRNSLVTRLGIALYRLLSFGLIILLFIDPTRKDNSGISEFVALLLTPILFLIVNAIVSISSYSVQMTILHTIIFIVVSLGSVIIAGNFAANIEVVVIVGGIMFLNVVIIDLIIRGKLRAWLISKSD